MEQGGVPERGHRRNAAVQREGFVTFRGGLRPITWVPYSRRTLEMRLAVLGNLPDDVYPDDRCPWRKRPKTIVAWDRPTRHLNGSLLDVYAFRSVVWADYHCR